MVTDSMESILADGRVMELMRDSEAVDQTLGEKVKQFFRDLDGEYYLVPFSAGLNAQEETAYSIGKPRQRSFPADTGSSSQKEALKNGRKASEDVI